MNDENNQELIKAVDKVTREIKRTNEKINAIFIAGIALFGLTITLPHDTFGFILGGLFLAGSSYIMLFSDRKL
ncbi:hypothetical protein [aff. Roholtiella sp. LEGE 12411]|uniref:hypothetical protein n=1 Tax=aff. Roholtiella sp. LEGE 12411 TaxID=1828822 RepID=UPI001882AF7F|nr:hypothetical protein [aff. Roholtiella sp. LEGE 12411]MBE9038547.1 hypothetical protein [aff. Roholtiella sp. LEGE 12411]